MQHLDRAGRGFQKPLVKRLTKPEEIRALADYNKALSQLALNEGSTLEKNHLSVDDR